MTLSRRSMMYGAMASAAFGGAARAQAVCDYANLSSPSGVYGLPVTNAPKILPSVPGLPGNWADGLVRGLHGWSRDKGVSFGTAIESGLFNSPDLYNYQASPSLPPQTYNQIILRECGHFNETTIPAMSMVWQTEIAPKSETPYQAMDALVNFATANNKALRLLPLIWYQAMPPWATSYFAARPTTPPPTFPAPVSAVDIRNAETLMYSWISTMMGRYRGRVEAWDVVNEPATGQREVPSDFCSPGANPTQSCVGPWFRTLGPSYIDTAFRIAREVDPKARLVLNEEDLDTADGWSEERRTILLRRLERLKSRNVPIDAVGFQAHISTLHTLDQNIVRNFMREIAQMGYAIEITELDIDDRNFRAEPAGTRDSNVGAIVKAYLDAALDEPNLISVTTWGLNDGIPSPGTDQNGQPIWIRNGWLNQGRPRCDVDPAVGHPNNNNLKAPIHHRSAPFDRWFNQKAFWWALVLAFRGASPENKAHRDRLRGRVI